MTDLTTPDELAPDDQLTRAWANGVRNSATIFCTESTRPSAPYHGQRIFESDTGRYYSWSETEGAWFSTEEFGPWQSYAAHWVSEGGGFAIGNGAEYGYFTPLSPKTFGIQVGLIAGDTTNATTGAITTNLPAGVQTASNSFEQVLVAKYFGGAGIYAGIATISPADDVIHVHFPGSPATSLLGQFRNADDSGDPGTGAPQDPTPGYTVTTSMNVFVCGVVHVEFP